MSLEDKYKKKNSDIQQRLRSEMEYVKKGQSKKNYVQLSSILEELENMILMMI